VTLTNVDSGQTTGTTTTDGSGNYSFPTLTPGANYEIQATKPVTGGTLTLSAILTPLDSTPHQRNLDPDSTVAAQAAKEGHDALKTADPTGANGDLETVAMELEHRRKEMNAPPPDLTNPDAVKQASDDLKQQNAADGTYYGNYSGDDSGTIAALIKNGHFYMVTLPKTPATKAAGRVDLPPAPPTLTAPASGADNSAATNGEKHIAIGMVDANGVLTAHTPTIKISGIFSGNVGSGTWMTADGTRKGTWQLNKLTDPLSGLYVGHHSTTLDMPPAPPINGGTPPPPPGGQSAGTGQGGDFAVLVLDDHSLVVFVGNSHSDLVQLTGTGTVDSSGAVQYTITDGKTFTITGMGQITGNQITGTYSTAANETGQFTGTRLSAEPPSM
jgi:hypothetical protein